MFTPPLTASLLLWTMFFPSLLFSLSFLSSNTSILISWHLFSLPPTHFSIPLLLDPTSLTFATTILLIAANVLMFASSYMALDPFLHRFTSLVMLFIMSMFMLIFLPHLMFLLLGWDGLGITSFLLVIYFQNPKSLAAGMITALMNRIGDVLLLISIALLLNQGHWTITLMFFTPITTMIMPLVVLAAMTKSAQIPFSPWLPAAMAAPTPVSALVHSSTLVTAGVFLLIRFYPSFHHLNTLKSSLLLVSSMTMLMAGMAAMTECDLKKIIALSTLSQLGLMIATLALGMSTLATFHLLTHALFKALLFICAGTMIHFFHHTQDLRHTGNAPSQLPLTTSAMTIANLALCGTPFLAGFYSKDLILEMLLFNPANSLITLIFLAATILTAAYSTRFSLILLFTPPTHMPLHAIHDEDLHLTMPMFSLASAATLAGSMMNWTLSPSPIHPTLPLFMKLLPLASLMLGILLSYSLFFTSPPLTPSIQPLHQHMSSMWFLTPLTSQNLIQTPLISASLTASIIDHAWLPTLTSHASPKLITLLSTKIQPLQSATINSHLLLATFFTLPLILI